MNDSIVPQYGWADLDTANKAHYKRVPVAVRIARKAYDNICVLYAQTDGNDPLFPEVFDAYLFIVAWYEEVYQLWQKGLLAETLYTAERDYLVDNQRDDRNELMGVGVQ